MKVCILKGQKLNIFWQAVAEALFSLSFNLSQPPSSASLCPSLASVENEALYVTNKFLSSTEPRSCSELSSSR
jgi:hypothetical protein